MGSDKTIGYFEVFYYDEDANRRYSIGYFDNEDDALDDFLCRSSAGVGDHNLCYMVGHGPSFRHICLECINYHSLDIRVSHIKKSNRFKEWPQAD